MPWQTAMAMISILPHAPRSLAPLEHQIYRDCGRDWHFTKSCFQKSMLLGVHAVSSGARNINSGQERSMRLPPQSFASLAEALREAFGT